MMAKRAGRWIAGAINFIGSDTLFGRHWGAVEHHPFLHFELCYYQAIEYAIAHKLKRVEAGAQGEHKLARGYLPVTTHSAHYIADPGLRRADRRLSRARARLCGSGRPGACGGRRRSARIWSSRNRMNCADGVAQETPMPSYDPQQHFRKDPARRAALPQGLRGRQGAGLPRHHAARARPHAGAAEGAGPQHARRRARRPRRGGAGGAEDRQGRDEGVRRRRRHRPAVQRGRGRPGGVPPAHPRHPAQGRRRR